MRIVLLISIIFLSSFGVCAQSFHYDTVPAPANNSPQLFHLEQTEQVMQSPQSSQKQKPQPASGSSFDRNRMVLGGSFGMVFGDYTSINVAPQVGYRINDYFTLGTGISYNYYKYDYDFIDDVSQNYLGLNIYARANPVRYISLQVQPEGYYSWGNYGDGSKFVPCLLLGGGVVIPAGNRGGISAMIYYDVIQYKSDGINYSPYGNQIVYSIGYTFNF